MQTASAAGLFGQQAEVFLRQLPDQLATASPDAAGLRMNVDDFRDELERCRSEDLQVNAEAGSHFERLLKQKTDSLDRQVYNPGRQGLVAVGNERSAGG